MESCAGDGNKDLANYASSHWELRWKIVSEGYEKYIKTNLLEWPECGSKEDWRVKMLNPNEWGDEIVLQLASNLLEVEFEIIPAFKESATDPGAGLTVIRPHITTARHGKVYLFLFSESDFSPAHYQSVWPRQESSELPSQNLSCSPPSLQPDIHVTEVVQMESESTMEVTKDNIENIEIIDYNHNPNR